MDGAVQENKQTYAIISEQTRKSVEEIEKANK